MSVLSEENTNMLFGLFDDIIKENNQKISINDITQLKQFITQQCYYYHNKRFDFANDINEMNKKIIDSSFGYYNQMIEQKKELEKRQKEQIKQQEQEQQQQQQMTNNRPNIVDRPISNINNNSNITLEYEKQKKDFISHIKPKQKEIDFSDPNKDKPINNLDIIMNQTLADRQKELMQITQQYNNTKQTKEWLNTKLNNESEFKPSEPVEILKIDKSSDLKLETQEIKKKEKRVTFSIEEQDTASSLSMNSLLSKLKKKLPPSNIENKEGAKTENISSVLSKPTTQQENEHFLSIIEKLNIVILNQENIFKEINNIKSNQDKILVEINEFKSLGLPPI